MNQPAPGLAAAAAAPLHDRALAALLFTSAALNLIGLGWGLPSPRGWSPDELLPPDILLALRSGFSNGWHDKYPPLHYYVLGLIYLPAVWADRLGRIDIESRGVVTTLFIAGRALGAAMGTASIGVFYLAAREIFDRPAALAGAVLASTVLPFVYHAKIVNVDVPALFWFALSLLFFLRAAVRRETASVRLFALTATLAVCTKDQSYAYYLLPAVHLAAVRGRHLSAMPGQPSGRLRAVAGDRAMWGAAAIALLTFVLCHNIALNRAGFVKHVAILAGPASEDYRMFPGTPAGQVRMLVAAAGVIAESMGWLGFALALVGLWRVARGPERSYALLLLTPIASYYVFLVAVIGYHYDRFFLGTTAVLSMFAGRELAAWLGGPGSTPVRRIAAAAAIAWSVWRGASVDFLMLADSRYAVERWLAAHVKPGEMVAWTARGEYMPRLLGLTDVELALSTETLERVRPDYVIVNHEYMSRFTPDSPRRLAYDRLSRGREPYERVLDHKSAVPWSLLSYSARFADDREDPFSNLDKINPRIVVFRRRAGGP
jgi:hypothetical protein